MSQYPGYVIKAGQAQSADVTVLQQRLNEVNCGPLTLNGTFDVITAAAVRLFQSRNVDVSGRALKPDGEVGPRTWFALFGPSCYARTNDPSPIAAAAYEVAFSQIGVREDRGKPNTGPEVNQYLASNETPLGSAWCAAFVHWCYAKAANDKNLTNPTPRTAGVHDHWRKAAQVNKAVRITRDQALAEPKMIPKGSLFVVDRGKDKNGNPLGHIGFVEGISGGFLSTIEGNTDIGGTGEGDGVYRRGLARKIADIDIGFIVYG